MSEIATGKLVIWMRLQAKRITPDGNSTSIMLSAAADRLESQDQTIAALTARAEQAERERDAAANALTLYEDALFDECDKSYKSGFMDGFRSRGGIDDED